MQRAPRHRQTLLILDLFREGFSTQEILRLRALRARYPHAEHLSDADRARLAFLKWQIERGMRGERPGHEAAPHQRPG